MLGLLTRELSMRGLSTRGRLSQSLFVFVVTLSMTMFMTTSVHADSAAIDTPQGKIIGDVSDAGISIFKGVPYALPPTGVRRWRHAEPAPNWTSERLATRFGPHCPQNRSSGFYSSPISIMSEDCLYLNVWTPGQSGDDLPVMVWIHGGSLRTGSGSNAVYDGTALARKGVIVVTVNYRLGVLGYYSHPGLAKESPHHAAGNYGTSDQIAALEWVRQNISAYGGDPANVTIFGESAGAWSVHHLMASPLARGLFHKAITQSGSQFNVQATIADRAEQALEFQKTAGVSSLDGLRAIDWRTLQAMGGRFSPVVDGWIIPEPIYEIYAKGRQNVVPAIIGFNKDEMTTLGGDRRVPESVEQYHERAARLYGDLTEDYLAVYPATDIRQSTLAASRDATFGWGAQTLANLNGANAYFYLFTHAPGSERLGAYHAAEIAYAFNNIAASSDSRPLAEAMSDYWVSFAKTGVPRVKGRPEWQTWDQNRRNYMDFGTDGATPREALLPGTWAFFEKLNAARRRNPDQFGFRR